MIDSVSSTTGRHWMITNPCINSGEQLYSISWTAAWRQLYEISTICIYSSFNCKISYIVQAYILITLLTNSARHAAHVFVVLARIRAYLLI